MKPTEAHALMRRLAAEWPAATPETMDVWYRTLKPLDTAEGSEVVALLIERRFYGLVAGPDLAGALAVLRQSRDPVVIARGKGYRDALRRWAASGGDVRTLLESMASVARQHGDVAGAEAFEAEAASLTGTPGPLAGDLAKAVRP